LFINRNQVIQPDVWYDAEAHPTKGFAVRPGWHCAPQPHAPHLSLRGRVWCEVEIESFTRLIRPHIQGGAWLLANRMRLIRQLN
jgi:hypothetical protein